MISAMAKRKNALAKRLQELRKRLGDITQVQAAEKAGVTTATWIAWENGQRKPGRLAMRLLREAFPDDFKD